MIRIGDEPAYKVRNREFFKRNTAKLLLDILPNAIPQPRLPILDWAEKKLRVPTGRRKGQKFDRRFQPCTSLFLELCDDPRFRLVILVGPNQQGKSYAISVLVINTIDNWREDCIFGLPDLDGMWGQKWRKDIQPVLDSPELGYLLDDKGAGSQGGVPKILKTTTGRTLQAMGAGSSSSQRSSATSRVVIVTELKDFGKSTDGEGDKFQQLVRRTLQYQGDEFAVGESTVTTEDNIAWQRFLKGTQTEVYFRCPHCESAISPGRDDLKGWKDAANEDEARHNSRFVCSVCETPMTETERKAALQGCFVMHKGQWFEDGEVKGPIPPTSCLSFRFSAATSMFSDAGSIGVAEYRHHHESEKKEKQKAYRELLQSIWAIPVSETFSAVDPLEGIALAQRVSDCCQFEEAPEGTYRLTGGVDVRKSTLHGTVVAWRENGGPVPIWWGNEPIREGKLWKDALIDAGKILQKKFAEGFPVRGGDRLPVAYTLLDGGWMTWDCEELAALDPEWQTAMGFGAGVLSSKGYRAPKNTTAAVRLIGQDYHVAMVNDRQLIELDASAHKHNLLELLRLPTDDPNAMVFPSGNAVGVKYLCDHLTGEVEERKNDGGESNLVFRQVRDAQHLLDSTSYAVAAKQVYDDLVEWMAEQQPDEIEYEPEVFGGHYV